MRTELTIQKDCSPILQVRFSDKSLEYLLEHDLVSYMTITNNQKIKRLNGGMIGVSVSQNGSVVLKHDYRTINNGGIEQALAHYVEMPQEALANLANGNEIYEKTESCVIKLLKDNHNSGGSNITMYNKGYIQRYLLPGSNPYS